MPTAEKILVIGPAWVGDMVMAQSLFKLLRQRDPAAAIDVVGPPWSLPLVARMPEVRRGLALDAAHGELALGARRRLGRSLAAERYDRAIVLPRSFKSALVPWFARVPLRTGYRAELRGLLLNDLRPLDRSAPAVGAASAATGPEGHQVAAEAAPMAAGRLDQTVKRLLALGLPAGAPLPEPPRPALAIDAANRAALVAQHGLAATGAVALMPGAAYGPAKQWPIAHFGELARLLGERGMEVWVLGSAGEQPLGEEIRALGGARVRNLCGATRLEDTVDLLSAASAAVTNDSGLMHVAAAAGTQVVAIYGSSSPAFTPPLTPRRAIHYLALDCSPCFQRECPLGHLRCLREIAPARVAASIAVPVTNV